MSLPGTQSLLPMLLLQSESRLLGKTAETRPGTGKIQCDPCVYYSGKMDVLKTKNKKQKTSGVISKGCRSLINGALGTKWETFGDQGE